MAHAAAVAPDGRINNPEKGFYLTLKLLLFLKSFLVILMYFGVLIFVYFDCVVFAFEQKSLVYELLFVVRNMFLRVLWEGLSLFRI